MTVHLSEEILNGIFRPSCGRFSPKNEPKLSKDAKEVTCELCKVTNEGQKLFGSKHPNAK